MRASSPLWITASLTTLWRREEFPSRSQLNFEHDALAYTELARHGFFQCGIEFFEF